MDHARSLRPTRGLACLLATAGDQPARETLTAAPPTTARPQHG